MTKLITNTKRNFKYFLLIKGKAVKMLPKPKLQKKEKKKFIRAYISEEQKRKNE